MNIEETFLDKIWLVVNDGLPEGELMLSGNDQDKIEQILKEYHKVKLKNLALSGVVNCVYVVTETDNYGRQLFRDAFLNKEQAKEYLAIDNLKEDNINEINKIEFD